MKEEPSVLDYLKSRLNPWSGGKIELQDEVPAADSGSDEPPDPASQTKSGSFPWLGLAALVAAVYAQLMLEPPSPQPMAAGVVYAFAVILLGAAIWRNQWVIPDFPMSNAQPDPALPEGADPVIDQGQFRLRPLVLSGLAALLAFFTFGSGFFDPVNVTLWFTSLILLVYSFWKTDKTISDIAVDVRNWLTRPQWNIAVTRWGLLLLVLWGAVAFYRFNDIKGVPGEPFSDQAEKLMDVADLAHGQYKIYFERNTGREFFQFYLTAFIAWLFNSGINFQILKTGTVICGFLTMPYIYLLGKEFANKRVAMFLLVLAGLAYWPNVISRIGLRFPLYPLFAAPALYYLLRGLRRQNRNDFILSGLFVGLGLHGYSPFRFVPVLVVLVVLMYLLHYRKAVIWKQTVLMLAMLALSALYVFLPLLRYTVDHPDLVASRSLTRLSTLEREYPEAPLVSFGKNFVTSALMMNVDNNNIWVHSVPDRPALEVVTAALFLLGYVLLLWRYFTRWDWRDLFMLLGVHLLMMPSTLSLAFPDENPSLNRAGGAYIVVFLIAAIALDGLYRALRDRGPRHWAVGIVTALLLWSALANYGIVFDKFRNNFRMSSWNTSDLAEVTNAFVKAGNSRSNVWVVAFPYWVDTRLVGVWLDDPYYNPVIWTDQIAGTVTNPGNKMFLVKEDDVTSLNVLRTTYPQGIASRYVVNDLPGKNFWVFTVPAQDASVP